MKQISTSLASKLKKDSVVERDYIIFKGETTRHYLWFNLYDDCYKDGNFIGTFVMKRIEITYNDSDLEFKNKEFNAYKEYKLDNGTWESINYGTFVVTNVDPSDTKEEITVTAYDYALKFANTYKTDLDYASGKVTLFQVLQEVCQKVGVELENTSIDNGNFIVDSNQFTEASLYGNVITAIAQMSCNFAKITPENKLKLMLENESNITIDVGDYEEFEDKRDTLPYTAVTLGMSNVEGENVSLIASGVDPDDAKYLVINDNPFAYTEEKRTQLIQAIFDKINGFGYSSFVLSNCLYPQLECGDLIKIKNKEGQLVNSIVLRPTFNEAVINLEAPSTITSTVSYVQPESAIDVAKRTEIVVDKQNQTITAIVTNVDDNTEAINNIASEGESTTNPFVLENAAELNYIQVDIHGNSQQETTTGKQMLQMCAEVREATGLTFTKNSDGSVTLNGEATANTYCNLNTSYDVPTNKKYFTLEKGKTYTSYCKNITSNIIFSTRSNSQRTALLSSGAGNEIASQSYEGETDTECYSYLYVRPGVAFDNYTVYPMVCEGSYTELEWEEYTGGEPSPNPDYPQEITTIKDSVKLLQVGKNKLKIEDQVITSSGITFTFKSGVCALSGTASANEIYCLIENTNFTINAGTYTCNNGSGNPYPYVSLYYDNSYHQINVYDDNGIKKFDLDKDIVVTKVIFYFNKNWIDKTTIFYPQIEQGDVATDFDAYKEKEYVIDLQGNELSKLTDDIKDKLLIDSQGNVILEKNIRHLSLAIKDMNNSSSYPGWKGMTTLKEDYPGLNDSLGLHAVYKSNITNNQAAIAINTYRTNSILFFRRRVIPLTQEEWITQYPDLVLELYYSLKTTETINLGKIDDFVAFKGDSTLWVETNLEPSYQLCRYYKDSILTNYFPTKNEVETKFEITNGKIESSINEIKNLIKYVSNSGSLTIENASENNLSLLSIKGDISLLFGNDGKQYGKPQFFNEDLYFSEDLLFTEGVPLAEPLYPSPNLFGKNMNLIVENGENEKQVYKLPFSYLNYISQEVADEFVLDNGKVKIIRRVGINSSMKKYELPEEVIEELGELVINLKEGTNKVYLQCFDSAIYTAGYMEKNDYTEQFATKVELNSSITQLSNEINLEVNGKIEGIDKDLNAKLELKVDTNKLISEINASADIIRLTGNRFIVDSDNLKISEDGTLSATNGNFSGIISADSGKIGGASIDNLGIFFNSGSNGWGLWGTTTHDNIVFHAGSTTSSIGTAPFRVKADGSMYATSGKIADYTIKGAQLIGNNVGMSGAAGQGYAFWSGSNTAGSAPFRVGHDGSLVATSASITGNITATTITCTNGTFAGWSVSGSGLSGDRLGLNTSTGQITVFPVSGGGYIISNGLRLSASAGAAISSNSNGSVAAPRSGLDLKGCSGATVYIGCMVNAAGTTEASCLSVENGAVYMRGGTFYVNGTPVGSSSSKNMKKNIRLLKEKEKNEIYDTIKNMNLYHYDYKDKYINGLKDNFGFLIEDIEDTILNRALHIKKDEKDENVKYYSDGDLIRTLLIVVQEMQKKLDKLGG